MFLCGALDRWKRAQHGPRVQAKAIEYISSKIEILEEAHSQMEGSYTIVLQPILEDCKKYATPDVSIPTLRRWWCTYEEW